MPTAAFRIKETDSCSLVETRCRCRAFSIHGFSTWISPGEVLLEGESGVFGAFVSTAAWVTPEAPPAYSHLGQRSSTCRFAPPQRRQLKVSSRMGYGQVKGRASARTKFSGATRTGFQHHSGGNA
jgi:hypothetical protein